MTIEKMISIISGQSLRCNPRRGRLLSAWTFSTHQDSTVRGDDRTVEAESRGRRRDQDGSAWKGAIPRKKRYSVIIHA
jgi:hypothetical protein